MDSFFAKFKSPHNPLDTTKQEEVRKIAHSVSELFSKNYLCAVKEVLSEEAEEKICQEERRRLKAERLAAQAPAALVAKQEQPAEAPAAAKPEEPEKKAEEAKPEAVKEEPTQPEKKEEGEAKPEEAKEPEKKDDQAAAGQQPEKKEEEAKPEKEGEAKPEAVPEKKDKETKEPGKEAEPAAPKQPAYVPGTKPHRPRTAVPEDDPRRRKDILVARVATSETLDTDVDPYISYVIVAYYKGTEGVKSRRYKEFKAMGKKLGSLSGALPKPSSKFGSRNLTSEFVKQRRNDLQKFLAAVCESERARGDERLQRFLGVRPSEDPRDDEIFARAVEKTRKDLHINHSITYDDHGEAISKLVMEDIRRKVWGEVITSCPPAEAVRKAAMKAAHKTLTSLVSPPVAASWNTAQVASKDVRKKAVDAIAQQAEPLVRAKHEAQAKLRDGVVEVMQPVTGAAAEAVSTVLKRLVPAILGALRGVFEKTAALNNDLTEALISGNEEKLREITERAAAIKSDAVTAAKEAIGQSLDGAITDAASALANVEAVKSLLAPLSQLVRLIEAAASLADPKYWAECVKHLLTAKAELACMDIAQLTGDGDARDKFVSELNRKLDWAEFDSVWWADTWGWELRCDGRSIFWELCTSLPVELGPVADVFWKLVLDVQKLLHRKVFKKWAHKFGDYVWAAASDPSDTREWKARVDDAFLVGYRRAIKCAHKQGKVVARNFAVEVVRTPALASIDAYAMPKLENLLSTVLDIIPEALRDLIDVQGELQLAIHQALGAACENVVLEQEAFFASELQKVLDRA